MGFKKIEVTCFLLCFISKLAFSELIPCTDGKDDWFQNDGYCYKFVEVKERRTWHDADQYCKDLKSELVSVESREENEYLKSVFESAELIKEPRAWIGLRAFLQESFKWSDGSVSDYFNWKGDVVPEVKKQTSCVVMLDSGLWAATDCDIMLESFICKKDNTTMEPATEPPVKEGNCLNDNWFKFNNKCYRPFSDHNVLDGGAKNFADALKTCQKFNATLASIHNEDEQDFMTVCVGAFNSSSWIGLKSPGRTSWDKHAWIDNTPMDYDNWAPGEPSNARAEPCVEMFNVGTLAGKWNDVPCDKKLGFICQMNADPELPPVKIDVKNCAEGFFRYQKSCYKIESTPMDWASAEKKCESYFEGHLLRIGDQFEQAYVNLLSKGFNDKYWLGFTDNDKSKNGLFTWTDGWPAYFTRWGRDQPQATPLFNRCVSAQNSGDKRWSVTDCSTKLPFICRTNDDNPPDLPLIIGNCPPNTASQKWIDVGNNFCYVVESRTLLSWDDAAGSCEYMGKGAELASFHSQHDLDLMKTAIADGGTSVWIGLTRNSEGGYFWQDGTAADFIPWNDGEPSTKWSENCVEILGDKLKYNNVVCSSRRGYICEVKKTPGPTTPVPTTTLPPRTDCGPEFKNWTYFDDSCYFFFKYWQGVYSWYTANEYCNNHGAHLVSIHSKEENDFIFDTIGADTRYYSSYWIGLNAVNNEAFEWTDDTLLNFNAMKDWNENLLLKDEKCVSINRILQNRGIWMLDLCHKNSSFICKRPFGISPTTITPKPTTRTPGVCPDGWIRTGNKCLKLFGEKTERANFTNALTSCQKKGNKGSLLSIRSEQEQSVATSLMLGVEVDVWIGLQKRAYGYEFLWTDGSRYLYQNWAPGQPRNNLYANICTMMQVSKTEPGKWKTTLIGRDELAYICQITPSTSVVTAPPTVPNCWTNVPGFVKYGNSCYKLYKESNQKENWQDADMKCKSVGARLATINNGLDENFLSTQLFSLNGTVDSLWIGLNAEANSHRFKWVDSWPVYFTKWGVRQPQQSTEKRCVFIDVNSLEWNTTACQDKRNYICKITNDKAPIIPIEPNTVCPPHVNSTWQDFGLDYCYYIESGKTAINTRTWGDASLFCQQFNAELASIHSQHEIDLITPHTKESNKLLWLGLIRKHHGEFEWVDNTPLNFEIWDVGEPQVSKATAGCGALDPQNGKWKSQICSTFTGFVCRIKKVNRIIPTKSDPFTTPSQASSSEQPTPSRTSEKITTKTPEITTQRKTVSIEQTTLSQATDQPTTIKDIKENEKQSQSDSKLGGGAVAGIVIAILASIAVVLGILYYLKNKSLLPTFRIKGNGYTKDVE